MKSIHLKVGVALAAGIFGTAMSLLALKKVSSKNKGEGMNKQMIMGGLAGGVAGAATALLLAPQSGSELLNDLYQPIRKLKKGLSPKPKAKAKTTRKKRTK